MVSNQVFYSLFAIAALVLISLQRSVPLRHFALAAVNAVFLVLLYLWSPASIAILLVLLGLSYAGLRTISGRKHATGLVILLVGTNLACFAASSYLEEGRMLFWIGLNFLILRMIHLAIDAGNRSLRQRLTPIRYLNFLLFFPAYLSGPIARYDEFVTQFEGAPVPTAETAYHSAVRITKGLFKSQVLAFLVAPLSMHTASTELLLESPPQLVLRGMLLHGVWLYLSFSGTIDVAIGIAAILGVRLPENFNRPYLARSLQEFWQTWHMSLLNWIRDYLYVPTLGFMRSFLSGHPFACTAISFTFTFALLGAWHGPGLHFLRFGLYHAAGMLIFLAYSQTLRARVQKACAKSHWRRAGLGCLGWSFTWTYVSFGWFFYLDREQVLYRLLGSLIA